MRNLINLERVSKSFGVRPVLDEVSLGIADAQRIGIVGRNGGGKSTLMRVMDGTEPPDSGRVTQGNDVRVGSLAQAADLSPTSTIREFVLGDRAEYEWSSDARVRATLTELLGNFGDATLDRQLGELSGGQRRRAELAKLLLSDLDVLILDEPTNHLDLHAISWLAQELKSRRDLAVLVVTHDRWFLDEVTDRTWEVVGGAVEEYDGGYSAFVLAKAERARQASAEAARRNNLLRKELAWLRRGAPARTSKPKFRIDAANELIAAEPPPRDTVELTKFAGARLGKTVLELEDVSYEIGDQRLLNSVTWNIGPGARIGIVGANGTGKTTLLRILLGDIEPAEGKVVRGQTVKPAYLSQHLDELNPDWRVLEAVEDVASRVELGKGAGLSASQLCERLGFGSDSQWTPVGDLSGGERRRLQITRLLMAGPNVLVLDEPTNDLDVETLSSLEDLLDSFAGTVLIVSHDRYVLERTCDTFVGLVGDGHVRDLPRGIDEYLELSRPSEARVVAPNAPPNAQPKAVGTAADTRQLKKEIARLERTITKLTKQQSDLHADLDANATDHVKVSELNQALIAVTVRRDEAEEAWLLAAEELERLS